MSQITLPLANRDLYPFVLKLEQPGAILEFPHLVTFSGPADYGHCGQIGFVPTLVGGDPDPQAPPAFIQINTPCQKAPLVRFSMKEAYHHGYEPPVTPVPEPLGISMLAMGVFLLWLGKGLRKR